MVLFKVKQVADNANNQAVMINTPGNGAAVAQTNRNEVENAVNSLSAAVQELGKIRTDYNVSQKIADTINEIVVDEALVLQLSPIESTKALSLIRRIVLNIADELHLWAENKREEVRSGSEKGQPSAGAAKV
jgi:hypothetical protein